MGSTTRQSDSRGSLLAAGVLSCSVSDFRGLFGVAPSLGSLSVPVPLVQIAEWPWTDPIAAILRFGGWTIDDVVSNREVAFCVRQLWLLCKTSQRMAAQREAENSRREIRWWRRQGCPIACPDCNSVDPCACGA